MKTTKLKILTISAFHPPYHSGGYEIRVKNIMDMLAHSGHEIQIITSKENNSSNTLEEETLYNVFRKLYCNNRKTSLIDRLTKNRYSRLAGLALVFVREMHHQIQDLRSIEALVGQFHPDLIYLGQIMPLSRSIVPFIAEYKIPVILDDGGGSLGILQSDHGFWIEYLERCNNKHSIFINMANQTLIHLINMISKKRIKHRWIWPENMKTMFKREVDQIAAFKEGAPIQNSIVLHSGVDSHFFSFVERQAFATPITILFPSRMEPRKGQIDAIQLVSYLLNQKMKVELLLVGEMRESYRSELEKESDLLGVTAHIKILPIVKQKQLIKYYQQSDICFFPSHQELGLSRVPLEAMSCGCIVISYGNEGSGEIIQDRFNGFLVKPGDYTEISRIIQEMTQKPDLVRSVQRRAREDIENKYSFDSYIEEIEIILLKMIGSI